MLIGHTVRGPMISSSGPTVLRGSHKSAQLQLQPLHTPIPMAQVDIWCQIPSLSTTAGVALHPGPRPGGQGPGARRLGDGAAAAGGHGRAGCLRGLMCTCRVHIVWQFCTLGCQLDTNETCQLGNIAPCMLQASANTLSASKF